MKLQDFDFRIWDKLESKFYYKGDENLFLFVNTIDSKFEILPKEKREFSIFYLSRNLDSENIEIELWSGFYDKNNKKIYEGDIVLCKECYGDKPCVSQVYFENGLFSVKVSNSSYESHAFLNCVDYLKVIGNIHENEELLKNIEI